VICAVVRELGVAMDDLTERYFAGLMSNASRWATRVAGWRC
jgi:hypothetical protein